MPVPFHPVYIAEPLFSQAHLSSCGPVLPFFLIACHLLTSFIWATSKISSSPLFPFRAAALYHLSQTLVLDRHSSSPLHRFDLPL